MVRITLAVALAALVAAGPVLADTKPAARSIDVVLCLDTSNSMDGLINSAKAKLWDIVNDLAKLQPTPNLRVALYSYGNDNYDRNGGWVRKEADLTGDLDQISKQLFALTTRGGTELVARVCKDALDQQKWSSDKDALRLIFVCGNEPASQDKQVTLPSVADLAGSKGVIVNTIFCGNADSSDARDWREFAALAKGRFINIDQDRGTVAIATPQDKKLAELSVELNSTYVGYGQLRREKLANQQAQDANAGKLGAAPEAARAAAKASGLYRNPDWDLVDKLKEDPKFDVTKIPVEELPESMRKMTPEERVAHVKKMAARRVELQKQIADISLEREAHIQKALKDNPRPAEKAFDEAVRALIREQAASPKPAK